MYSTRYYHSKKHGWRWYTTKSLTPMHPHLCANHEGQTFSHDKGAYLYLIGNSLPLDRPMGRNVRKVRYDR